MKKCNHIRIIEFLDYIKNIRGYSEHTIRSYKIDLNNYYNFCYKQYPNKDILSLNHSAIQNYLQSLTKNKLSAKTLARRLATIKSFYNYLIINDYVDINIAKLVKTPKINKALPHFLSLKEASELLKLPIGNNAKCYRDRLILILFYVTGVRISELIKIKIKDINFNKSYIYINGKGNKDRVVILGLVALQALKTHLNYKKDKNNSTYLFPGMRKSTKIKHISSEAVYKIVKSYLKIISDDEKLSPHSLRHSFATHMLDNGADLIAIKDLLGHSSLSSTQVYTHLQQKKIKKVYRNSHPHAK